jgi:hypothetical protein
MTTTVVALLDSLRAHFAAFELPELCSVYVTRSFRGPNVTAQLACHTPADHLSAAGLG